MPRAKLYLVRRDLETFTGPVTAAELSKLIERMAVGLRDEVTGHCGPWIFLDDRDKLKKFYSELLPIVQAASVSGWSTDANEFRNEPTVKGPIILAKKKPDRRLILAAAFFGLAVFAAMVAWMFAGSGELSSRIIGSQIPPASELTALLQTGGEKEFVAVIQPQLPRIIDRVNRNHDFMAAWLPFLRAYAFFGSGEIDGFSSKKLRGEAGVAAPADCSVKAWTKRWHDALPSFNSVALGGALPSDHWARLLAWDPHWINRRSQSGWIRPRNFYQGCVMAAVRAFDSIPGGFPADGVRARLAVLSAALENPGKAQEDSSTGKANGSTKATAFGLWTCMDLARSRTELDLCLEAPWQNLMQSDYNREKFYWSMLRLAVKARSTGDQSSWPLLRNDLQAFISGRDQSDSYTRMDYSDELHFVGAIKGVLPAVMDTTPPPSGPVKSFNEDIQIDLAH